MGSALIATSALALAAGPASAADMLSVGLGGYMEQWFGHVSRDDKGAEGGWDSQSDSEIHFKGSLESDMGLKFTVHVELEGNQNSDKAAEIDESFVRISGEFGQLEMGARDHAMVRMHTGLADAGVGLNAGDTQKWIPGTYLETYGHVYAGGDDLKLNYTTPRVSGLQIGVSYAPDQNNENAATTAPNGNDNAAWGVGANFKQDVGDMAFMFSLGHMNISQKKAPLNYTADGQAASDSNPLMTKNFDDKTYTNIGLGVGMGAFDFKVAYATGDNGGGLLGCYTGADAAMAMVSCPEQTNDNTFPDVGGAAVTKVAYFKDEWTSMGASVMYTDGPLSVSLSHMAHENEESIAGERTATMLSVGYTLAPGVSWRTSVFGVEDDTPSVTLDGDRPDKNLIVSSGDMENSGTGFVTGIKIGF